MDGLPMGMHSSDGETLAPSPIHTITSLPELKKRKSVSTEHPVLFCAKRVFSITTTLHYINARCTTCLSNSAA